MPDVAPSTVQIRKSGLIVPVNGLDRHERRMARSKFLRLLRHRAFARAQGLAAEFSCLQCHRPLKLALAGHVLADPEKVVNPKKDAFTLTCACTTWTVGR